jgi:uncharacterized membrane protein YkoI
MHVPPLPRMILSALIAMLAIELGTPVADAQSLIDRRYPRQKQSGEAHGLSRDEAVRLAESRYRAKAVRVETVRNGDSIVYEIRLLNAEGKVRTVQVDAATGQMN